MSGRPDLAPAEVVALYRERVGANEPRLTSFMMGHGALSRATPHSFAKRQRGLSHPNCPIYGGLRCAAQTCPPENRCFLDNYPI